MKDLISDEDYRVTRLQQLKLLDEKRQKAFDHLQAYQHRMSNQYNKKMKPREFQIGDLVLRENPRNQAV